MTERLSDEQLREIGHTDDGEIYGLVLEALARGRELAALRKDNEDLTTQRDVARESLELADKEVAALRKDKARIDLIDRLCQPDNGSGMTLKFGKTTASWSGECPIREELDDIAAVEAEGG